MAENNHASVNEVEPLLLERIAGQSQVVATLQMHLAAYWNDRQAGRNPVLGPWDSSAARSEWETLAQTYNRLTAIG